MSPQMYNSKSETPPHNVGLTIASASESAFQYLNAPCNVTCLVKITLTVVVNVHNYRLIDVIINYYMLHTPSDNKKV